MMQFFGKTQIDFLKIRYPAIDRLDGDQRHRHRRHADPGL